MRTTSVLVAALVAAASVAGHEATEGRRIYFPRHIKRQFSNATITSLDTPVPSSDDAESTKSTKRQADFSDLTKSLSDAPFPSVAAAVTTVVVQSTVFVAPNPTAGKNNGTNPEPSLTSDAPVSQQPSAKPSEAPSIPISKPPTSEPDPTSEPAVSLAPTPSSSKAGIVIAPSGVVSESTTDAPISTAPITTAPTTTAEPTPDDPLKSLISEVVSVITSVLPPLVNATESRAPDPPIVSSLPVTIPESTPPGTGVVPSTTEPPTPPVSSDTKPSEPTPPPVSSTIVDPPPPISNTTEPPPPPSSTPPVLSTPPVSDPPVSKTSDTSITVPPSSFTSIPPPPPVTNSTSSNTTVVPEPTPTPTADQSGVTSIPQLGSTTNSESWMPTTILVDPTSTTVSGGLAPTTATGIPTGYPRAITPESGTLAQPPDTQLVQIGLLEGYNYPFVVANSKAAAQIFQILPEALGFAVGEDLDKIQMRKLIPLDTGSSMGFITTLAIVSFPNSLIESLRVYVKAPNSPLYNNPDTLTFNFTKQINPAIDITIGAYPDDASGSGGPGSSGGGGSSPNGDPFNNGGSDKTSSQQGTTAAIVGGSVFVAAAYGAVMFILARRYKKKKQAHRRASSISNNSSEMRHTPSPALMGGALLSRDFTGYGGVAGAAPGVVAGGRDSHGSGRSGMNNSARTQYISAPVAAENSLGWN